MGISIDLVWMQGEYVRVLLIESMWREKVQSDVFDTRRLILYQIGRSNSVCVCKKKTKRKEKWRVARMVMFR